tara:strand:+ start:25039 stop:25170 length:132 start_codon:yes stop_codon:yes gene_type:complete
MNAISTPKVETEEPDAFRSGAKPMFRVVGLMAVMEAEAETYGW